MLVNCPKCGFSQPEDRYCAACGVDITAFKPVGPSVLKKIITNIYLHITLIVIVCLAGIFYVNTQRKNEISARMEYLRGGAMIVEAQKNAESSADTSNVNNDTSYDSSAANNTNPRDPREMAVPASASIAASTGATPEAASAKGASALIGEKNSAGGPRPPHNSDVIVLHAYYAEIDNAVIDSFKQDGTSLGQYTDFGDFKAGAIPDLAKKMKIWRGINILQKIDTGFSVNQNSQQWFLGEKSGEDEVGVNTLVSVDTNDLALVHGEVEVLRNFRDENSGPNVARKPLPVTAFELAPGVGWFITIPLSRSVMEEDRRFNDGILKIFQSNQWKAKRSEFTLLLEFDIPTPTNK